MIIQLLIVSILAGVSSYAQAAQICLDRDEFASLIQKVEQTSKELANVKAQVSLYQKANEARKEELRVSGEYVLMLERYKEIGEELSTAYEQRDTEHAKELDTMKWHRNMGWGAAVAVTIGAVVFGFLK